MAAVAGGENKEKDLLAVAVEIQRMLEAGNYRPLPVSAIGEALSMQSHMILLQYAMGLVGLLESHQAFFKLTDIDGCQMASLNGVPWLGPEIPKKDQPSSPCTGDQGAARGTNTNIMQGLPRGKALLMMGELAEMPALQEALREIAQLLSAAPRRTLLVSEIGSQISQNTRGLLRSVKLRAAQLLQCFPNDFCLSGQGPATAATYRHFELKTKFIPQPSPTELNSSRYYRLLKLCADITERFGRAKPITAREVLNLKSMVIFVDCRSEAEKSVSVIPNSLPQGEVLESDLAEPQLVVAYCCIGAQSAEWCHEQADGMWAYKVRYLEGGIASWAHHNGSVADQRTLQPVPQIHCWMRELAPFFPVAGSGYELVLTDGVPLQSRDVLAHPTETRLVRLRSLAWDVRLRYWPSVFCLEASDLKTQLELGHGHNYLLVDCRTPEERQVSTLSAPGSVVIAADELRLRAADYVNAYSTIITFCTIGGRSGMFCKKLVDELIEFGQVAPEHVDELRRKIVNMLGGLASWAHVGGGFVDSTGRPTYRLHPWCQAFLDMFPLENLELVFDEARQLPQDALSMLACKSGAAENPPAVPQQLLQMCTMLPPEVIHDGLTRAMQSCNGYED